MGVLDTVGVPDVDRQKYKQTDRLKTARGRRAPIPVVITFRCLRLMRPLGLDRSAYGLATSVSTQLGRGLVIYA